MTVQKLFQNGLKAFGVCTALATLEMYYTKGNLEIRERVDALAQSVFATPHYTHGLTAISFRAGLPNIVAAATKKEAASLWREPQYWGAPHEAEEPKVLQRSVGLRRKENIVAEATIFAPVDA